MDTENKENIENKENVDSSKAKKEKKKFEAKNLRMNVSEAYEKVQSNVPLYIGVAIVSFVVVVMAAVATFFLTVKGPEQVLVPNVVGKQLEDALKCLVKITKKILKKRIL